MAYRWAIASLVMTTALACRSESDARPGDAAEVVSAAGQVLGWIGDGADSGQDWMPLVREELAAAGLMDSLAGATVEVTIESERERELQEALAIIPDTSHRFAGIAIAIDGSTRAIVAAGDTDPRTSLVALRRPTGSVLKFLIAAAAVRAGVTTSDLIDARHCLLPTPDGPTLFANEPGLPIGPLAEMAAESVNCAFAKLYVLVGSERVHQLGRELGLADLGAHTPKLATGSASATPRKLAGSMAAVLGGGTFTAPHVVARVTTGDGVIRYTWAAQEQRVLSAVESDATATMLKAVVERGTAAEARLENGRPAAGKTGTQENSTDAWMVGGTPQLTVAVWMGNPVAPDDGMTGIPAFGADVEGGTLPAQVWKTFLDGALAAEPMLDWIAPLPVEPRLVVLPGVDCADEPVAATSGGVAVTDRTASVASCDG
jgi:penicillin-binding protein 1A